MANLGFVGLGVMGSEMVNRPLSKGHTITGYNRTRAKAEWLVVSLRVERGYLNSGNEWKTLRAMGFERDGKLPRRLKILFHEVCPPGPNEGCPISEHAQEIQRFQFA